MGKKLIDNGLHESSRMILPEFREAYLNEMKEQERRGKPVIDEQEVQLIEQAILESYHERRSVALTVFSPFDDEVLCGVVELIDKPNRRIKIVRGDEDYSFLKLEEIISATII